MFWRQFYFLFMFLFLLPKALLAADQRAILDLSINEVKKGEVVVLRSGGDNRAAHCRGDRGQILIPPVPTAV